MNIDINDILAELDRDTTVVDELGISLSSDGGNTTKFNSSENYQEKDGMQRDVGNKEARALVNRQPQRQHFSATRDFEELMRVWRNERCAPELLPYPQLLIGRMMKRIQSQMETIENISMGFLEDTLNASTYSSNNGRPSAENEDDIYGNSNIDNNNNNNNKLPLLCMEAEIERVKFVIRSLLRCRLHKIDRFSLYLRQVMDASEVEYDILLSDDEKLYHERHFNITLKLFNNSILKNLPVELQTIDDTEGSVSMIDFPDWKKFVFVYVKEVDIDQLGLEGTSELGLTKNEFGKHCYTVTIDDLDEEVEMSLGGIYVMRYDSVRQLLVDSKVQLI
ncbi:hypothetical protein TPHA_0A00650 [Tetrapisispora phaffii CBS 4417]|uniref:DNA replication complex GINS protein SLD5 n=1 Tax=Tetrapisispora phaffii (strain ATCC 24235 / CBS 4417 / NBRC 1672 / NRRL Y-8282 / UCD 70-5) TaxID=1071381 RepID=G8BMM2_TETPH|nr:hypothetical protein TPHA_0A00650 [Tetrapisispora phaffii CBS 4417]CCE61150.1 hypothetical protein TPHA_0A00650 [Tetrapisispora phaffii CBS 4417]